jgi:hypothetical protein
MKAPGCIIYIVFKMTYQLRHLSFPLLNGFSPKVGKDMMAFIITGWPAENG